jgi:hypothetical protein
MVHNTRNQPVYGLCASPGFLTQRFGNWICFCRQVSGGKTFNVLDPSETASLNLKTETHPVSEMLHFLVN